MEILSKFTAAAAPAFDSADTVYVLTETGTYQSTIADLAAVLMADTPIHVYHGGDATVVRPSTTRPVTWIGTVDPNNSIDGDMVYVYTA